MAFVLADRVKDTTTSTGTGTITLAGAPPAGFQSFAAIGNANNTYYTITGAAEWEVGIGTYTVSGTTLSRDTVLSSSNAGSAVNFSAGIKDVFVTYPSSKAVMTDVSQTLSAKTLTGVSVNVTGDVTAGANANIGSANSLIFSTRSALRSPADSLITLLNNAGTDFARLQFGGITASFPALRRNATSLDVRLADDSGYAPFRSQLFQLNSGSMIGDTADGVMRFTNSAGTDFTRLNFGGTTSAFPALARNGATLESKLADNSSYGDFSARKLNGLGTATSAAGSFFNLIEKFTTSAIAATGTINLDAATNSCLYYTTNASANWTVNLRLSSTAGSLNTALATGESMTFAFAVTQGGTAFYNTTVQVDGTVTGVTTKWLGGAPTSGNVSGIDVYSYCVVKTAAATFTVFASVAQFK